MAGCPVSHTLGNSVPFLSPKDLVVFQVLQVTSCSDSYFPWILELCCSPCFSPTAGSRPCPSLPQRSPAPDSRAESALWKVWRKWKEVISHHSTKCSWVWAHGYHCPQNPSDIPPWGTSPCLGLLWRPWVPPYFWLEQPSPGTPLRPPPRPLASQGLGCRPLSSCCLLGDRTGKQFLFYSFLTSPLSTKRPNKVFF